MCDLRHLTVSSNATSVAIPSLRAPTVRGTAASRSAAHQLQQPSVIDGQARAVPFARANRTETRVRKLLVLRCCCAALPPTRPVIQGIEGYPPLWAPSPFRRGRPGVVPLLFLIQRLLWTSRWCDGGDSARFLGFNKRTFLIFSGMKRAHLSDCKFVIFIQRGHLTNHFSRFFWGNGRIPRGSTRGHRSAKTVERSRPTTAQSIHSGVVGGALGGVFHNHRSGCLPRSHVPPR